MSVPLELLAGTKKLLPQQLSTNLKLDNKCIVDVVPFSPVFSVKRKSPKKILSFFSPTTPQPKKRKYGEDTVAIHK
jgi:hypothetical protein